MNKPKQQVHKKKAILWVGSILTGAVILALAFRLLLTPNNAAQDTVQFAVVTRGSIIETVDAMGVLESQPSALLTWESDGVVDQIMVCVGDVVKKGDVLLELTDASKSTDILKAENSLLEAQMELENIQRADANLANTLKELAAQELILTYKYTWNYGDSSAERIDESIAEYKAAEREVWELEKIYQSVKNLDEEQRAAAYDELRAAEHSRDLALWNLEYILGHPFDYFWDSAYIGYRQQEALVAEYRAAYLRYLDTSVQIAAAQAAVQAQQNIINQGWIVAPFDGTVTEIYNFTGQGITAGVQALRIDNLDNLFVEIDILQSDINKVRVGNRALVSFNALPNHSYEGYVQSISGAGKQDSDQVTFRAVVRLKEVDEAIMSGFTALASIVLAQADEALLVPNQSLVTLEEGGSALIRQEADGSTQLVSVETGASANGFTAVFSEQIAEGDQVAVAANDSSNLMTNMDMLMVMMNSGGGGGRPPEGGPRR